MDYEQLRIRTLLPMSYNGVGPSFTCMRILQGIQRAGVSCDLVLNRTRRPVEDISYRAAVPRILSLIPYRFVEARATERAEEFYLSNLNEGDVAYLWPAASLRIHQLASDRGAHIILEGINTRMARAKQILDAAYDRIGLPPAHGITEERIAEEEEKLGLASAIFAPSPAVEGALEGSTLRPGGVISSSYGTDIPDWTRPEPTGESADAVRVLFVGYACVRKGFNTLLEAWGEAGLNGELIVAGDIEPAIRSKFADLLSRPDVRTVGFVRDVCALYRSSDIFVLPSLEEGDPLVTYEAAAHGLPLVVSREGAGRMGSRGAGVRLVDARDPESLVSALRTLAGDTDEREALGRDARFAVEDFRWSAVGARRAQLLRTHLMQGT